MNTQSPPLYHFPVIIWAALRKKVPNVDYVEIFEKKTILWKFLIFFFFFEKSVSYHKKDGSFFWYDNDSGH